MLISLFLLLVVPAARASTPTEEAAFKTACEHAFSLSTPEGQESIGVPVCRCTVREQKQAHVSSKALVSETKAMTADPKYQFKDRKLLDSFHYCAIAVATGKETQ